MKLAFFCFTFIAVSAIAQSYDPFQPDFSAPPNKAGFTLVWHDEFNNTGKPDTTNWIYEHGFVRNEELQWYSEANANCKNGVLLIEGRKEKIKNKNYNAASADWRLKRAYAEYTSASIQTRGLHQWQYGCFEIRARIDTAKGAWPAIWTLGVNGKWPANGETDIMEFYRIKQEPVMLANTAWGTGKRYVANWHTEIKPLTYFTAKDAAWVKKFHVWKMEWDKESIKLFLDDELLNITSLDKTINVDGSNPFLQPQYILLNLAMGGNGGDPSAMQQPITYEVDYVRVYQKVQ
ncbi:glycoside hydrolase family 16 protein [Panacibacter ginsenosidivorans]|uniref:Glycoside hydrolase family 16 protein n=1 Tax=Panacibacter ginsenosidivorans TaxID=1813871 RepID=A0A5B8VF34_9BACT|nr:glycoside hydrolase family 16 protein [Panacibacter ginsenosidivorans]QEC69126.1 glycoside hydrolase family 16 protein [Panacibacter ginsenosidivorans]